MQTIKDFLKAIPLPVYIVGALLLMLMFWWFSDDIGTWWEKRTQAKVDAAIAVKQTEIDTLNKEKEALLQRAVAAEAKEQSEAIAADLLKQEAAKHGINIDNAQKQIDAAAQQYINDIDLINKVKNGEASKIDLCLAQCKDSADLGYPCRANYCDKFK